MRARFTGIAMLLTMAANAQLTNGSFEDNGAFSYVGWDFDCNAPQGVANTPPGGGSWSASKEVGNVKGCSPSYLYQAIPFAQVGEIWTLSAWTRSDSVGITATASISFGGLSEGTITTQESVGHSGTEWTFLSITDTIVAASGGSPVVVLNPGISGGPASGATWFDEVELVQAGPLAIQNILPELHSLIEPDGGTLHVSAGDHTIRTARLFDLTGRALPTRWQSSSPTSGRIDVSALGEGVYIVQVGTDIGLLTARFFKR